MYPSSSSSSLSSSSPPLEALKPEERGLHLIQLLIKCANHTASGDLNLADECLCQISRLASLHGDSMQRLAAQFASALAVRLVKNWPGIQKALNYDTKRPKLELDPARVIFTKAFPYLGFAYAIIARTLLQAMSAERVIHIVDLGSADPKLWAPLLQSFAALPDGPPHLKITCVHSNKAVLEKLGLKLVKEAEALDMPFQYNPLNVSLRELTKDMLKVRLGEALGFVSILNLHVLLAQDDQADAQFRPKKSNIDVKDCKQMGEFLGMVRSMYPKVVLLVEQEAHHNSNHLVDRFIEGLHYYSAMFDSLEASFGGLSSSSEERFVLEEMFGREIENIVAWEGVEREERHERYAWWMVRFCEVGFKPVRLWLDSMEDSKKGYKIISQRTSLMICWNERPLYAVSAWTC
ncbi:scarecrow-like protein 3 [Prunus avium]|uniref:Scarecrow-like protein 3 n=1 Tax=Prunus avium TaxID=42229 RepID=A0A6P5SSZ1_PRUAV|nr:scarecrow-like protein 3 [Prunus avium]